MYFYVKSTEIIKLQWEKLAVIICLECPINNHDKIPFLILIIYVYIYMYVHKIIFFNDIHENNISKSSISDKEKSSDRS